MRDEVSVTRGLTIEGRAHEFLRWHAEHRPELPWPVAFQAWLTSIGGLDVPVVVAVRAEITRLRKS